MPEPMTDERLAELEQWPKRRVWTDGRIIHELVAETRRLREAELVPYTAHLHLINALIEALGLDPDTDDTCVDGCVEPEGSEHMLWHLVQQRDDARAQVAELEEELVGVRSTVDRVRELADTLDSWHDDSLVTSDYPMIARRIRLALDGGA